MGRKRPGYDRDYYLAHREEALAKAKAYREANLESRREADRRYGLEHAAERDERVRRWNDAHPGRRREISKNWAKANPVARRATTRRYRQSHPENARADRKRRRVITAGILLTIRLESTDCGICFEPIDTSLRHPDPSAPTIGHEPPLAIAKRDGWRVVVERPEHFGCNLRKGVRQDGEL